MVAILGCDGVDPRAVAVEKLVCDVVDVVKDIVRRGASVSVLLGEVGRLVDAAAQEKILCKAAADDWKGLVKQVAIGVAAAIDDEL
jgi:hypothetical protein